MWQIGTVHWFDRLSGEGMIRTEDQGSVYVHYSSIISKDKWKTLTDGARVKYQIYEDCNWRQISKVKEIK